MIAQNCLTYIGYFYSAYEERSSIVLCVSDEAWKCKYYCEKIRKLSRKEYEVREVMLDEASRYALFEDFILEEFDENYNFLTTQDIAYLTKEVDTFLDSCQSLVEDLKRYRKLISKIPGMKSDTDDISKTIFNMNNHLSSVTEIRALCSEMYKSSIVFSSSIYEYLECMKSVQYDRELNDMYTWRLLDDKS